MDYIILALVAAIASATGAFFGARFALSAKVDAPTTEHKPKPRQAPAVSPLVAHNQQSAPPPQEAVAMWLYGDKAGDT
ncbi:MAG: hypothetical protein WCR92_08860 [Candidatus Cloacimonadaceae bacterium]